MAGPARIHPVPRRGSVEYYAEIPCPDCGASVFVLEDEPAPARRFDDLVVFGAHHCHAIPVMQAAEPPRPGRTRPAPPVVRSPAGFPVDLGEVPGPAIAEFRAMVEAAFGKPLRRFTGVLKRKGLPVHFTQDWAPHLGHVREFSKSDVHRPLAGSARVFVLALPHVRRHFSAESGTSLRKYYFSAKGVSKHERDRAAHADRIHTVIRWRWPLRSK